MLSFINDMYYMDLNPDYIAHTRKKNYIICSSEFIIYMFLLKKMIFSFVFFVKTRKLVLFILWV